MNWRLPFVLFAGFSLQVSLGRLQENPLLDPIPGKSFDALANFGSNSAFESGIPYDLVDCGFGLDQVVRQLFHELRILWVFEHIAPLFYRPFIQQRIRDFVDH